MFIPKVLREIVYDHAHREHGVDMSIAAQLKVHDICLSGGVRCKSENILIALGRRTVQAREYPNVLSGGRRCKPVEYPNGPSGGRRCKPVIILLSRVEVYGASPLIS